MSYPTAASVPPMEWEVGAFVAGTVFGIGALTYSLWAASRGLGKVEDFVALHVPSAVFVILGLGLMRRRKKLVLRREQFLAGMASHG